MPEREARLQQLLGVDYDYAHEAGLVGLFDYDPKTGEDGLMHTLAGEIDTGHGDVAIPGGFHHEASGKVWGMVSGPDGSERPANRVERGHLEEANSAHRKKYRERPAEPYLAQVALQDRPKMAFTQGVDGTMYVEPAKNAMYPKEYDALAVMQAVRMAYESSDPAAARPGVDGRGRPVLINDGRATLIDGVSTMPIRLVINPENKRLRTAYPLIRGKTGIMNLTEEQMMAHVGYQTPTSSLRR